MNMKYNVGESLDKETKELMAQNLVEVLHNNPDFMEFSEQTMKKIILGEIEDGNNS